MKIIASPREMQRQASLLKKKGKRIALVPTMGALHEGHLSLLKLARKRAEVVVMSRYVNPTQFGPKEDFKKYPRPRARDHRLAREEKVDILFEPETLYASDASTIVEESTLSQGRCGADRPGHFRGVTTVVCKLFLIVQPSSAVFGLKDAQQVDVIERMVRDLHFPITLVKAPIIRDANGLALSSRNAYLSAPEYEQALALPKALQKTSRMFGKESAAKALAQVRRELKRASGLHTEYVEYVNGRLCAAVKVGKTRLLDNVALSGRL